METTKTGGVPRHVAVIMDGNGRWAQKRLLPRSAGHRAGMNNMIALSEKLFESGVEYCTFYTLSAGRKSSKDFIRSSVLTSAKTCADCRKRASNCA